MFKYSVNLIWSEPDNAFVATVPEFPGLSAFGNTLEEAAKEAEVAVALFIEDMEEDGEAVPSPRTVESYSGQFRLRIPKELHREASIEAERQGISLNSYLMYLLATRHAEQKIGNKLEQAIVTFENKSQAVFQGFVWNCFSLQYHMASSICASSGNFNTKLPEVEGSYGKNY